MNRKLTLILSFIVILVFMGCSSETENQDGSEAVGEGQDESTTEQKQHEIIASHTGTDESAAHQAFLKFKEYVEDESEGSIKVDVMNNGELYASERESIEAVQLGNIQMSFTATAPLTNFEDKFALLDLPFLVESDEDLNEILDGDIGEQLIEDLPDVNLKALAWGTAGMSQITNNKGPIEHPDDLNRLKFRVMENDIHLDTFNALGAEAQPFAFGELYTALQQNIFDAQGSSFYLTKRGGIEEVQDYLTISNHSNIVEIAFINNDFYESLSEKQQKIIDEGGKIFTETTRKLSAELNEEAYDYLQEHIEINELTSEQRQEFIDATQSVYDKYEDKIGTDLIEEIREFQQQR